MALGGSWVQMSGEFEISNNSAVAEFGSQALVDGVSVGDVALSAAVTAAGGACARLILRYQNPTNFYLGNACNNGNGTYAASIEKVIGGTGTILASTSLPSATGTLGFSAQGLSLALDWNGSEVLNVGDSSIEGAGAIGFQGPVGLSLQGFQAVSDSVSPVPVSSLPYSDSFMQANSPVLGGSWIEESGAFGIKNQRAVALIGGSLAVLDGVSSSDVSIAANVSATGTACARLLARYENVSNFYESNVCNNGNGTFTASFAKDVNGTVTTLASASLPAASGNVQFTVQGSSLVLYLNGTVVLTANDSSLAGPGSVGIAGPSGASFQNYSLAAIPALVPASLPIADSFARANSLVLGGSWVEAAGAFNIVSNKAVSEANGSLALLYDLSDYNVSVSAQVGAQASGLCARLIARYENSSNYYEDSVCDSNSVYTLTLTKVVKGVATTLGTASATSASGTLGLDVTGSSIEMLWNGKVVKSVTDSAVPGPGTVGIQGPKGASFQNFSAQ
jgi:hypothetical protein